MFSVSMITCKPAFIDSTHFSFYDNMHLFFVFSKYLFSLIIAFPFYGFEKDTTCFTVSHLFIE